ncbi:MAG: 30S ribosome-binding factor RbfA [Spirochaetia bacterium]|nr:30S ribosome-binding factor RbfA [Spirochaetia bacterium]
MSEYRLVRIENLIQQIISELILTGKIKDHRVSKMISVSRVKCAQDLSVAKVYVSGFLNDNVTKRSVEGLNSAAPFIQGIVGKKLQTRLTPRLTFCFDSSIREGFEINKKIEELLS